MILLLFLLSFVVVGGDVVVVVDDGATLSGGTTSGGDDDRAVCPWHIIQSSSVLLPMEAQAVTSLNFLSSGEPPVVEAGCKTTQIRCKHVINSPSLSANE